MATRARAKRDGSVLVNESLSRPAKRSRKGDQVAEGNDEQNEQDYEQDSGRQEAMRFSQRATAEPQVEYNEQRRELIQHSLPDLTSIADALIRFYSDTKEQRTKAWMQHLLKTKKTFFYDLRQPFEEPRGCPFVDTKQLGNLGLKGVDVLNIGHVNFASALVTIDQIESENTVSPLEKLGELDEFLGKLYEPFHQGDNLDISLNIRTIRFLQNFEEESERSRRPLTKPKVVEMLASYFVDPSAVNDGDDILSLLHNGPFKSISHADEEDPEIRVSLRVHALVKMCFEAGKGAGFEKLQEEFPFDEILANLRTNIISVFRAVKTENGTTSQTPEQYHDAQEAVDDREDVDDDESVAESQPIIRHSSQGRNFFGPEAIRALDRDSLPPSNQQIDDSNSMILGNRPSSVAPSTATGFSSQPYHQSETPGGNAGDDEEDCFEEDTRGVDKGKAADVKKTLDSRPQPESPSSSMPPPPRPIPHRPSDTPPRSTEHRPSDTPQAPPSSMYDFMREEKRRKAARARELTPAPVEPGRQRQVWSEHDTSLLIRLVRICQASWADIAKQHNDEFEYPRNAQAYRDKARNLKTDVLGSDHRLPPGFDNVHLGFKEIAKLKSMGVNPYRKERDVDDMGQPINKTYVEDQ